MNHAGFELAHSAAWPGYYSLTLGSGCTGGPSYAYDSVEVRIQGGKLVKRERTLESVDNSRNCDQ